MIGKLLAGTIGFVLAGPIGAIAAVVLANVVENKASQGGFGRPSKQQQSQQYFFICTFTLYGKLAKVDGKVSNAEIEQVEKFMSTVFNFDPNTRRFAIGIFREAVNSPVDYHDYAKQFYQLFGHSHLMLSNLLASLYVLANSDNEFHSQEKSMIDNIAEIFHISPQELNHIFAHFTPQEDTLGNAYKILEINKSASDSEIKKQFRNLAKEHHPDRAIAKGLPEEFISMANKKFAKINNAYDTVCKDRKI